MQTLLEAIRKQPLVGDGAMGTQLQLAGLEPGGCGESWNVKYPERIERIQRNYVEAGSDILLTNTFGACRIMLERHGFENQVPEINRAGAAIARRAFGSQEGYVLGDIGPFGGLMKPYGEISPQDVQAAFQEQAQALVEGGADGIIIETQTSLEELRLGIEAAKKANAPCVIASMAFDITRDGSEARTMMGIDPETAAKFMASMGVDVAGLNCGSGIDMEWAAQIARRYRRILKDIPVMAQPNAGLPELIKLQVVYKQTPKEMAADLDQLLEAGARIVGGCCGSTPAHLAEIRRKLDQLT